MMKIEFLEFVTKKLPSDRAHQTEDCSMFQISIDNFVVREFNQYDRFYCHMHAYDSVFREARNFAEDLADIIKLDRPRCQTMVQEKVIDLKWVPKK